MRSLYLKYEGGGKPPGTAAELGLGAVAGGLGQIITIPISVVTTRQQTQSKAERKGMLVTAREIVDSDDGVSGLWRGLKASLVLVVNPSITYGTYSRLKTVMFPNRTNLRPWEAFGKSLGSSCLLEIRLICLIVLGAASKSLATILTQPLIVAKVRLQSKPPPERQGKPFKTFGEVLAYTIQHEGWLSLFKGIGPQLLKGLLVQGILMMTKERYGKVAKWVRALDAC